MTEVPNYGKLNAGGIEMWCTSLPSSNGAVFSGKHEMAEIKALEKTICHFENHTHKKKTVFFYLVVFFLAFFVVLYREDRCPCSNRSRCVHSLLHREFLFQEQKLSQEGLL